MAAPEQDEINEPASNMELKTFQANFRTLSQEEGMEEDTQQNPLKIICVGDYTGGVRTKGIFIKDYLGIKPTVRCHPFTCIDFYLKKVEFKSQFDCRTTM